MVIWSAWTSRAMRVRSPQVSSSSLLALCLQLCKGILIVVRCGYLPKVLALLYTCIQASFSITQCFCMESSTGKHHMHGSLARLPKGYMVSEECCYGCPSQNNVQQERDSNASSESKQQRACAGAACIGILNTEDGTCTPLPPWCRRSGPRKTIYLDPPKVPEAAPQQCIASSACLSCMSAQVLWPHDCC